MRKLKLNEGWLRGIEPFIFFGELNASRTDGTPLTDGDRLFVSRNKEELVFEIKDLTYGPRVRFESFIEDRQLNPYKRISNDK